VCCGGGQGKSRKEKKRFATFTHDLLQLADWLAQCGVTHVPWSPPGCTGSRCGNILAEQFEVLLVNAQHIKAVPGRKTDQKDSEWIADLLQHGLLRGSFVPPQPHVNFETSRVSREFGTGDQPDCESNSEGAGGCHIKLASVATDALGASGRAILEAMLAGEQDAARLAEMSKGLLRNKIPELQLALEGRMTEHIDFCCDSFTIICASRNRNCVRSSRRSKSACALLRIRSLGYAPFPGVERVTAWGLLAEIGLDMNQFPSSGHLASLGLFVSREF